MPVFISYNHGDRDFVDRLARQLVRSRVNVWLDRWELKVGDSLISNVQSAISGASALLVILSQSSVQSEWCKKELNAGLVRELSERRVLVLPVVSEECEIPLFLKDKLYADFRDNFDNGLQEVLIGLAPILTENQGRIEEPEWHTDWSIDWGDRNGSILFLTLTMVETTNAQPYSVFSEVHIEAGKALSDEYFAADNDIKARIRRRIVHEVVTQLKDSDDVTFQFEDNRVKKATFRLRFQQRSVLHIYVRSRWLGRDTGRAVLFRLGGQLSQILRHMEEVSFSYTTS
jgi:hypothetical protein